MCTRNEHATSTARANVEPMKTKMNFTECEAYKTKPMVEIMLLDAAKLESADLKAHDLSHHGHMTFNLVNFD
jgi:hypothetical protein